MLAYQARAIANGISAIMAVGLLIWFIHDLSFATDFSVYHRTANDPLWLAYIPRSSLPFPYAPTMLLWVSPLEYIPMWPAFVMWVAFSIWVFAKACRQYLSPAQTLLVIASPPLANCLGTGQVSAVMAAILLWACGTKNRVAAGIGFAVIASIKPQLVIMAPLYLLLTKDFRAFASAGLTFLFLVALSIVAYGPGIWLEWFNSLEQFHWVLLLHDVVSVAATPAGAAERWGLPPLPFLLSGIASGAYIVYKCRNPHPLFASATIGGASLLAAPYALTYDLAAIVPFLVWSVYQGRITSAVALSGALHPLPLVLGSIELVRQNGLGHAIPETAPMEEDSSVSGGIGLQPVRDLV